MKIKFMLIIIFINIIISIVNCDIWQYCDGAVNPTFKINTLTVTPDPPKIGKACIVQLEGSLNEELQSGTSTFNIEHFMAGGWRPLPTFHNDICSTLKCPVAAGPFTYSTSINVPIFTPHGQYRGKFLVTDQASHNVTCLTFAVTLNM